MERLSGHEEYEELSNEPAFSKMVKEWKAYRSTGLSPADIPALSARAEKAEAKIKSIHESLNFADKSRSKCANYVELAVSNGLALGKIAVAIQHDYDDEPPKGE